MAMSKIERIDREIQKTREKITEYQNKLKGLEAQKTEAENLEIVQLVRSMRLTPQSLTLCYPAAVFPAWLPPFPKKPQTMTKNRRTPRMNKKILRTLTAFCAALYAHGRLFRYRFCTNAGAARR